MLRHLGAALLLLSVAACAGTGQPLQTSEPAQASSQATDTLAVADATREDGRFAEAMQLYQEVLVRDPKSVAANYGVAESLLALGKPGDARPMFEALVQDAKFHSVALQGEGLALLALNQREQAAKTLHEAVEADPSQWRAWNGLGLLADFKRESHEAEDAYGHALALNPDSAALHNNLGYSRLVAGKGDEAMGEFRKAYGLDPKNQTIQNNIRLALAAKGNYADAIRGVSHEAEASVLNNVGFVAMQRGDFTVAEGYLARAMENSPSFNFVASRNLDQLKAIKGDGQ
jgi:Flp pilus assembly protein TadD